MLPLHNAGGSAPHVVGFAASAEPVPATPSLPADKTNRLHLCLSPGHTGAQHCVRLMDTFTHTGPHGTHVCEVFEAMGDDLLTLLK